MTDVRTSAGLNPVNTSILYSSVLFPVDFGIGKRILDITWDRKGPKRSSRMHPMAACQTATISRSCQNTYK
jgi:hypothetical protein